MLIVKQIKKNGHLFLSTLLLTITIAIFGPIELYYTNYEEFWFSCQDVFIVAAILGIGCFGLLVILGLILKDKARDIFSCLVFVIGVALYIQGNYANIDYGVLNGEAIDWSSYSLYAVIDTLGWIILIVGLVFLWKRKNGFFHKIQKYGSLWIITIQLITLMVLFFSTPVSVMEKSNYYLSNEGIYDVSTDENIVIFVLDAFDDAYFQEIIEKEPQKYQEIFKNFIHYNNAATAGTRTKLGVPAIITGQHYPGGISYKEYIQQAFNYDGLYATLQEHNYNVGIYSASAFVPDKVEDLVNNQVAAGYAVSSYPRLANTYFKLTLYKYMPHFFKRFFWIYSGDFEQYKSGNSKESYVTDDAGYFNKLQTKGLHMIKDKNIFRLIYLNGAHPPYTLNEYAQPIKSEESSAVIQGKAALYIVNNYIEQLKALGIYDTTTILIMADHGDKNHAEHALLLVKEKNGVRPYTECTAPVSYYDLHATLFSELGITNNETFFDIKEDAVRERYFYENATEAGHIQAVEYVVNGNMNDNYSVQATGVILEQTISSRLYQYGTLLSFGADNTALDYIVSGINSIDMQDFSWTDDKKCEFEFEFDSIPKENLLVTMDIKDVYIGKGPQQIIIYANNNKYVDEVLEREKQIQFVVDRMTIDSDKKLLIHIELPDAIAPAELYEGGDARTLGVAFRGLCIEETSQDTDLIQDHQLEAVTSYIFGRNGNVDEYLVNGWHSSEEEHTWASEEAELLLKTNEICDYDVILRYSTYPYSGSTSVYVNGTLLITLEKSNLLTTFRIPKDILKENGVQVMEFKTSDAVSPNLVGKGEDCRTLGVGLYSMDVVSVH